MQLTIQVSLEIAGNRRQPIYNETVEFDDPLLAAAVLHIMSFQKTLSGGNTYYRFSGEATLSFIEACHLDGERCDIVGFINLLPNGNFFNGCVTYTCNIRGYTPGKGLTCMICMYHGQIQFPGPEFFPLRPQPTDTLVIELTHQQRQNQDMLFRYGYKLLELLADIIISSED